MRVVFLVGLILAVFVGCSDSTAPDVLAVPQPTMVPVDADLQPYDFNEDGVVCTRPVPQSEHAAAEPMILVIDNYLNDHASPVAGERGCPLTFEPDEIG